MMLIIQIALGIVFGVLILRFLPQVIKATVSIAAILVVVAVAGALIYWGMNNDVFMDLIKKLALFAVAAISGMIFLPFIFIVPVFPLIDFILWLSKRMGASTSITSYKHINLATGIAIYIVIGIPMYFNPGLMFLLPLPILLLMVIGMQRKYDAYQWFDFYKVILGINKPKLKSETYLTDNEK